MSGYGICNSNAHSCPFLPLKGKCPLTKYLNAHQAQGPSASGCPFLPWKGKCPLTKYLMAHGVSSSHAHHGSTCLPSMNTCGHQQGSPCPYKQFASYASCPVSCGSSSECECTSSSTDSSC
ncbi:hypothetical protein HMI55_005814 [Coelomomyces lativittatus]|nr:hypothetical protein HMI55_005814 [Coelomomyces lativittatus]